MPIREQIDFDPLTYADVVAFGLILYGSRWRTAFARHLGISRRLIDFWKSSKRRITPRRSREMTLAVGRQHQRKSAAERATYDAVIKACTSRSARDLLLAMLAEEIDVRIKAVALLARNSARESDDAR